MFALRRNRINNLSPTGIKGGKRRDRQRIKYLNKIKEQNNATNGNELMKVKTEKQGKGRPRAHDTQKRRKYLPPPSNERF